MQKIVSRKRKILLQKYMLILFSMMLLLSPFSSLGELAYAEGESGEVETTGVGDAVEEEDSDDSADELEDADEVVENDDEATDTPEDTEENDSNQDEETDNNSSSSDEGEPQTEGQAEGEDEKAEEAGEETIDPVDEPKIQALGGMQLMAGVEADYEWEDNADGVTITEYKGTDTEVEIPDQLDGKDVTVIGERVFEDKNLTKVTFPASLKEIHLYAFSNNDLEKITLPQGLEIIGEGAFRVNKLQEVSFPSSLNTLGTSAFLNNQLSEVNIPDNVTDIRSFVFSGNKITSVRFPAGIKEIPDSMFHNNELENVTIPETVETIGTFAFAGNKLKQITIPSKIKKIDRFVFSENDLTSIELPENVMYLDSHAFSKNKLTEVTIHNKGIRFQNINHFGDNQADPANLTIKGHNLSRAKEYAAEHGYTFEALVVDEDYPDYAWTDNGDGTVTIDAYVGEDKEVTVPAEIDGKDVTIIEGTAFIRKDLTKVNLPSTIIQIGSSAFSGNNLSEIVLPSQLEYVGSWAFEQNELKEVTLLGKQTELTWQVFRDNQTNPTDLTIKGYAGSTAEDYATRYGYTFEPLQLFIEEVAPISTVEVMKGTGRDALNLPTEIKVTLNDGSAQNVTVTWNNGSPTYDADKAGEYTFTGEISVPAGVVNKDNLSAKVTVKVSELYVVDIATVPNKSVALGTEEKDLGLPEKIQVTLNNNDVKEVAVDWGTSNPLYDVSTAGNYVFTGTLDLPANVENTLDLLVTITVEAATDPKVESLELNKRTEVFAGVEAVIEGTNTSITFPDNLPSGTFLTVLDVNEEDFVRNATGIEVAGDVLEFAFEYPNNQNYTGEFTLTMDYDGDKTAVDIYYYNEDNQKWIAQAGDIDKSNNTITLNPKHFSTYGVFAEKSDDSTDPEDPEIDPCESQDPLASGCPEDKITDEEDKDVDEPEVIVEASDADKTSPKKITKKGTLPITATNIFTMLFVGIALLLIGIAIRIYAGREAYSQE